jgi:hypothetical protein
MKRLEKVGLIISIIGMILSMLSFVVKGLHILDPIVNYYSLIGFQVGMILVCIGFSILMFKRI